MASAQEKEKLLQEKITEADKKDKLVKYLFKGVLNKLKALNLKESSPSIFLVYAHDSKDKKALPADMEPAQTLIDWLHKELELNLYSDRTPFGQQTNSSDPEIIKKRTDILWSQLCLLPDKKDSVDYVILCGSQLLKSYGDKEIYSQVKSNVSTALARGKRDSNSQYASLIGIMSTYAEEEFHHLLRELIFLDLRLAQSHLQPTVIPLLLNGDGRTALPNFTLRTDVYNGLTRWREHKSWKGKDIFTNQNLHLGLFWLLEQLYVGKAEQLQGIKECKAAYETSIRLLQKDKLSKEEIDKQLDKIKVMKAAELKEDMGLLDDLMNEGTFRKPFQEVSGATSLTLETVVEHLRKYLLDYANGAKDQDLYTPLEGFYDVGLPPREEDLFEPLEGKVIPFLSNSELETLLILGEAGSGKTKFAENITRYLCQFIPKFIPIYIRLVDPNINDPGKTLIPDALKSYGLSDDEVALLLSNKELSFCFIFDGTDELIRKNKTYERFYITNNIHGKFPKSHCIFTGRLSGFSSKEFEDFFVPVDKDGETSLRNRRARTITLAPFNERTKKLFIKKFIENRPVSKELGYGEVDAIYERINNISNLNDIVGRPILLMMTMTVLPYLEGYYQEKRQFYSFEVVHKDLLHMYTHDFYTRAAINIKERHEGVVSVGGKDSDQEEQSVYDCIMDFSIAFAKQLNNAPVGQSREIAHYRIFPSRYDEDEVSPEVAKWAAGFKKLFSKDIKNFDNQDEFDIYRFGREGCELLDYRGGIPGRYTYSFIHEDFLDYFATLLTKARKGRRKEIEDFYNYRHKTDKTLSPPLGTSQNFFHAEASPQDKSAATSTSGFLPPPANM
jgi:hypothetical protein